ncbi:MAG: tetratricopeptide repeat protein [Spirochaetota bacterium]
MHRDVPKKILLICTLFVLSSVAVIASPYEETPVQDMFSSDAYERYYQTVYNCRPVEELERSYAKLTAWIGEAAASSEVIAIAKARASMVLARQYVLEPYCKDHKRAEELLSEGLSLLDSVNHRQYEVERLVVRGEIYGVFFLMNKAKYLFSYGRKSQTIAQEVWELDRRNPRAILLKSNQLVYTPKIFGGNPRQARELLLAVVDTKLLPVEAFTALTTLGLIEEQSGREEHARSFYERAAAIYPDNKYISRLVEELN